MAKDLTQGRIMPMLIKFTIPLILGNIFQLTYNAVDSIIVGRFVGKEALAAVGICNPITTLIILFLNGLCMGASILMGNYFGGKKMDTLSRQISTTMISGMIFSLALTLIAIVFTRPILMLVQVDRSIMTLTTQYLRIIMLGLIFTFLYNFFSSTLRALGDSATPLYFLIISAVLNVFGDLFFVVVLKAGSNGCAVATVVSEALCCVFCMIYIKFKVPILCLGKKWLVFDRSLLKKTISYGWASAMQQATVQLGKIVGVNTKTDVVSGKVLSVSQDSVEIEGYGSVKLDEDFIMYEKENSLISNYSSIIVGYALQDFIVADGEVCGAIKNKPLQADNIRVIIKTSGFRDIFFNEAVFCADSGMIVETGEESYETAPGETVVFNPDTEDFNEGRIKLIPKSGEIQFQSVNRGIGTPSYGGTIEVSLYDEGIVVVNEVGIEDYLKKVVPSEMPSGFNLEALKCQAVCARSYAYTELSNNYYSAYGAHIDDSIQFQVYNNSRCPRPIGIIESTAFKPV